MPATIAAAVAKFATAKVIAAAGIKSLAAAKIIYAAAYAATYVGVTVGASYVANSLLSDTPDADSAQGSIKQSIPPRIEAFGEGKLPGYYMLWEALGNHAYDVMAFHHGRAEAIDEVWSHDHVLTILPTGWVEGGHEYGGGNNDLIHIEKRLGLATETAYSAIVAALGSEGIWTNNHRGDGIASIGVDYRHAKQENLLKDFPNGDPSWSAVGRWKRIWDPRFDSYSASKNTAVQIMDLLTSPDGFAQDYETTVEPVLEHWIGEMNICDEAIPQKVGGTAPRYESFVYRAISDDPVEALKKLLSACDGRLTQDEDGCYRLWVGKYRAPSVFLTEDDIHGYDVAGDASTEDVVNELVPSFKSPAHGWNMVETDPWRDSADAAMRGSVETSPFEQEGVTNNSQVRRLAKREMSRLLAPVRGVLDCKLSAARAMGQRWIGVDLPELAFDHAVIEIEEGGQTSLQGLNVSIPFVVADPNADAWNAATEEGDGPQLTDRIVREALETPTISSVEVFTDSIGGSEGVRLRITAGGPARDDLGWAARWRVVGSSSWVEGSYPDIDAGSAVLLETTFVAADDLEVEVAYTTGGGGMSDWSLPFSVGATIPGAWTPAALGSAVLGWWDARTAATVTRSDGTTSAWSSRTGGHVLAQGTAALKPGYSDTAFDGASPGVAMDGASTNGDYLTSTTGPFAASSWVFLVVDRDTQTTDAGEGSRTLLITARSGAKVGVNVRRIGADAAQTGIYVSGFGTGASSASLATFGAGGHVVGLQMDGSGAVLRVDGGTASSAAAYGATAGTELIIGGHPANNAIDRFAGVFGEVLVIDKAALPGGGTAAERETIEGYLAWRWGLQSKLPTGHPYKTAAP